MGKLCWSCHVIRVMLSERYETLVFLFKLKYSCFTILVFQSLFSSTLPILHQKLTYIEVLYKTPLLIDHHCTLVQVLG